MLIALIVTYLLAGWTVSLADGWRPSCFLGYAEYLIGVLLWPVATVVLTVELLQDR